MPAVLSAEPLAVAQACGERGRAGMHNRPNGHKKLKSSPMHREWLDGRALCLVHTTKLMQRPPRAHTTSNNHRSNEWRSPSAQVGGRIAAMRP